jgi:uncharacterized lipoprotein YmbA
VPIVYRPVNGWTRRLWWVPLWVMAVMVTGCFGGGVQDQFYMLQPVKETPPSAKNPARGPLIGLGPIKVPAYLDRPQIVTAASDHEYRLAESQRWAERLDDNIARVSLENLAALVPTDRIVMHPWSRETKPDAQVALQIQELHVDPEGHARMVAFWSLKSAKGETANHRFSCSIAVSPSDFGAIVGAESECLGRLNREMAQGIQHLEGAGP